jgi:hypothetical protein
MLFSSSLIVIQMDVRLPNGDVQCWGRCQSDNFKVVFFVKRFQFVDAADENKEKVELSFSLCLPFRFSPVHLHGRISHFNFRVCRRRTLAT